MFVSLAALRGIRKGDNMATATTERLDDGDRIVRPTELCARLGIGMSTLYEWLADGTASGAPNVLPRPRQIGPRAVGWPLSEVDAFIKSLPVTPCLPRSKRGKAKRGDKAAA